MHGFSQLTQFLVVFLLLHWNAEKREPPPATSCSSLRASLRKPGSFCDPLRRWRWSQWWPAAWVRRPRSRRGSTPRSINNFAETSETRGGSSNYSSWVWERVIFQANCHLYVLKCLNMAVHLAASMQTRSLIYHSFCFWRHFGAVNKTCFDWWWWSCFILFLKLASPSYQVMWKGLVNVLFAV